MFSRFIRWLLDKLDYVPRRELDKANELLNMRQSDYNDLYAECMKLKADYDHFKIDSIIALTEENAQVRLENDRLQANVAQAEEYYKSIQKQLSELLHGDVVFGFKGSMAFPGATVVSSVESHNSDGPTIQITGRTVLTDQTTDKIQHESDINTKYNIALMELIKYGVMDKITQSIVKSGSLQFTLGYNANCTALEIYYTIQCLRPESILNVDIGS